MTETIATVLFALLSVTAFVICAAFVVIEVERDPFSQASGFSAGVAGFSVFPVINILVAVLILLYWARHGRLPFLQRKTSGLHCHQ